MRMEVMFGILFMITGAAVGSLNQDPAVCTFNLSKSDPCYVALGRRLHLHPPQKITKKTDFRLKKNLTSSTSIIILDYKNPSYSPTVSVTGWQFINDNYTIIINQTEKSDSAKYGLEITDDVSGSTQTASLHLNIEAPVSLVSLTYTCSPITEMKVSCSAEGDELQYRWTGASDQHHQVEDQNKTLRLDKNFTGSVTCHVQNHISSESKNMTLQPCPGTTTTQTTITGVQSSKTNGTDSTKKRNEPVGPTDTSGPSGASISSIFTSVTSLIVMSVLMLLLMAILIAAFLIYKKRHAAKKKDSSQDGGELVYARVSHNHPPQSRNNSPLDQEEGVEYATVATRSSRKKPRQVEDDVQYGELVFNTPARTKPKKIKEQDEDCVYSQVRQGR